MNTRQMEIFVNIVRHGNFSNAAKRMYLSQPAVSSNIDMLEKELGCKLLIRQGRKTSLTEKGRIFYEHCLKVMALTEDTLKAMGSDEPASGAISIAASFVPGLYLLPGLIKEFHGINDQLKYTVTVANSRSAYESVLALKCDMAFTGSSIKNDALVQKRIFTDDMILIAPKDAPYTGLPESVSLAQVKDMPFVMRQWGSSTLAIAEKAMERAGVSVHGLNVVAEFDSGEAVIESVSLGLGVSLISSICVAANDSVLKFPIQDAEMKRDFYALIRNGDYIPPRIQQFYEFLPEV